MKILAIETSCDETGIAILETTGALGAISPRAQIKVLADVLVSQASIHAEYGGVFPSVARREHAKNMMPLLVQALSEAELLKQLKTPRVLSPKEKETLSNIFNKEPDLLELFQTTLLDVSIPDIDAIAVTSGPGLEPALWVGINTAEALGALWGIPVIPVNHMEGHIFASLLAPKPEEDGKKKFALSLPRYPALALLISGGHTELVLIPRAGTYEILGQTRDDAVGEAFDKVARMLGLAYPGGPEISKLAEKARNNAELTQTNTEGIRHKSASIPHESAIHLPRPMLNSKDFDFSFAGLKTAVHYLLKKTSLNPALAGSGEHPSQMDVLANVTPETKALIAKDFEDSVTEVLLAKTLAAAKKYKVHEIILGGGVSANKKIRSAFHIAISRELPGVTLFLPDQKLSTDNGLMIGVAGLLRSNKIAKKIIAEGRLKLSQNSRPTLAELRRKK